jgi:hypothetical protein
MNFDLNAFIDGTYNLKNLDITLFKKEELYGLLIKSIDHIRNSHKNHKLNKEKEENNMIDEIEQKYKKEIDQLKKEKENLIIYYNKEINNLKSNIKEIPLPISSNSIENKSMPKNVHGDKYVQNIENDFKCPISIFKDLKNDSRRKAAKKTFHNIIHYFELYKQIEKDSNNEYNIIEDTLLYILK